MKNTLPSLLLLFTIISFAQENKIVEIKIFKVDKLFSDSNKILKSKELINIDFDVNYSNSEKKFATTTLKNKNQEDNFIKTNNTYNIATSEQSNLTVALKKEFINKIVIAKILEKELGNHSTLDESKNYGDRNIELYKNYDLLLDKLNASYHLNDQMEIQIGKNVYPNINKTYKSIIDQTLQNSLNLLVINF